MKAIKQLCVISTMQAISKELNISAIHTQPVIISFIYVLDNCKLTKCMWL